MATKTKSKRVQRSGAEEGLIEKPKALKLLADFSSAVKSAVDRSDLIGDADLTEELNELEEEFRYRFEDCDIKELPASTLLDAVNSHPKITQEQLNELAEIPDYSGCIIVEVRDLARRQKLQEFLESEIYPLYADQQTYIKQI